MQQDLNAADEFKRPLGSPNPSDRNWASELRVMRDKAIDTRRKQMERTAKIYEDADLLACLSFHKNPLIDAAGKGESQVEIELMEAKDFATGSDPQYLAEVQLQAAHILAKSFQREGLSTRVIEYADKPATIMVSW